jgi:uncharacterized RDD family membrane protein YckC
MNNSIFFLNRAVFPLAIATISLVFSFILYPQYMSDDAFIHAGFIKGLLNGEGFNFAGNKTYGSTSPLWTLIVAAFCKLSSLHPVIALRIGSGFFGLISIIGFYFLLQKTTDNKIVSIAGTIVVAFNVYLPNVRTSMTQV